MVAAGAGLIGLMVAAFYLAVALVLLAYFGVKSGWRAVARLARNLVLIFASFTLLGLSLALMERLAK
jgi:hypothetical protein